LRGSKPFRVAATAVGLSGLLAVGTGPSPGCGGGVRPSPAPPAPGPGPAPAPPAIVPSPTRAELIEASRRVLAAQDRQRAARGLAPLSFDERLMAAASAQALDCAHRDRLTHTGADGSDVGTRVRRAGFRWRSVAENAAMQPMNPPGGSGDGRTAEWAVDGWMQSRGHRANLLGSYTHCGAAFADTGRGTRYWVAVYARPE
jgi:uncharacterized protein YkwD